MRDDGKGRPRRPLIQEVWVAQCEGPPRGITEIPHVFPVSGVDKP
jgi:hypothetical protein